MDNNTLILLAIAILVVGGGGGFLSTLGGGVEQEINFDASTPKVVVSGVDAITGAGASTGGFEVIMAGVTTSFVVNGGNVEGTKGDTLSIRSRPDETFYSASFSGTLDKTLKQVALERTKQGTATLWVENDPENATARNSITAYDTWGASDTDTAKLCAQGSTNFASFGDNKFLVAIDVNAFSGKSVSLAKGTKVACPSCHSAGSDVNATSTVCYEVVGQSLTTNDTWCANLTLKNGATDDIAGGTSSPRISLYDEFDYIDADTGAITTGYFTDTCADTNSATNPTVVYYYGN